MADELIVLDTLRAEVVFAPGGVDVLLDKLERDVRAVPTDISTKAGRTAVASLAMRVARSKTALDELGKNLVADWKTKSAVVDADRRRVRDRLDCLRDEVRRPLTDWEEAEKSRINCHEIALSGIQVMAQFGVAEPAAEAVAQRIAELHKILDSPREWHEFAKRANDLLTQVSASLHASHAAAVRREAERAELERLRKEAREREQRERDDRLRAEAAEAARRQAEAEATEAARVLAAKEAAERARVDRERLAAEEARRAAEVAAQRAEREKQEAAEEARRATEAAAQRAEQERVAAEERAERARVAAEEKARRDAEAAVEAERARAAAERQAAEAEVARREADERHREVVHAEIAADLARRGFTPKQARTIVDVLATGGVPHVRIIY